MNTKFEDISFEEEIRLKTQEALRKKQEARNASSGAGMKLSAMEMKALAAGSAAASGVE